MPYFYCLVEELKETVFGTNIYEIYELPNDEHDILLIFEQRFGGECTSTRECKHRGDVSDFLKPYLQILISSLRFVCISQLQNIPSTLVYLKT